MPLRMHWLRPIREVILFRVLPQKMIRSLRSRYADCRKRTAMP